MSKPINSNIRLRPATLDDAAVLARWDKQPHVIAATTDNPSAAEAFEDVHWPDELAQQDEHSEYLIADLDGLPIGAMQVIDPREERTHYWGDVAPNLRALDIWIGEPEHLGKGHGESMMRLAFLRCFEDPAITAILIDPLASNTRAIKFYQRLGFEPLQRRMFDDDDCLVHVLERDLWHARYADDISS